MAHAAIPAGVLSYRKSYNGDACLMFVTLRNTDWKFQENVFILERLLIRSKFSKSLHFLQNHSLNI